MNNLINYIIENHKITNIKDDIIKILFLYNYRYSKNFHWVNIIWTKYPKHIEDFLIECYKNDTIYNISKYKYLLKPYENIIKENISNLNNNTIIKFLHDYNYLSEEFLILLSKVTDTKYNINGNIIIRDYLISENDIKKQILLEKNDYLNLGIFKDKNIKFDLYYKELVKINNQKWIIITSYKDVIIEEIEGFKMVNWIFSKLL